MTRITELGKQRGLYNGLKRWRKNEHLERMQASGLFRHTKEIFLHNTEMGNAERLAGMITSLGRETSLTKAGLTEEEIGLDKFRDAAKQMLGDDTEPWLFSYRVRVGIV